MIKKRKKMLFIFIVIIIAVLLFSVIWVISVYLAGPQPSTVYPTAEDSAALDLAAQEAIQDALNVSGSLTITDDTGEAIDMVVGTGS